VRPLEKKLVNNRYFCRRAATLAFFALMASSFPCATQQAGSPATKTIQSAQAPQPTNMLESEERGAAHDQECSLILSYSFCSLHTAPRYVV
jgi:hypothetical protein